MKKYRLGDFEEIVLLTVGILHGQAYGVSIKDEIENRVDRKVSVGALQTTLRRLEKKGFLASKHADPSPARGGRPKLYFTMTSSGRKAIEYQRHTRSILWNALPEVILDLE